jgi:hypothetical protein
VAAVGAVAGAVVGAAVGAASGATVGTAAEPGGGTVVVGIAGGAQGAQTGVEIGTAAGAAVGALAPVLYTKGKDAAAKIASQLDRALDHLAKLNGPDQSPNPRRGWRQSVRDAANQIDKQADRIPNANVRNAAHFVADWLRESVGPE